MKRSVRPAKPLPSAALEPTVRFGELPSWEVVGAPTPGGRLAVEYAPGRVLGVTGSAIAPEEMILHVRFQPGDRTETFPVLDLVATEASARKAEIRRAVVDVPRDACQVELWFELRADGRVFWDSDYGRNFVFDVAAG